MKSKNIALLMIVFLCNQILLAAPVDEGKAIFTARCASCHNVKKQLTGPALAGVAERRSIDWIINFVHSSQTMVSKGDTTAVALYNTFNKIPMPDHPDLSAADIKNIVTYITDETKKQASEKTSPVQTGKQSPAYVPLTIEGDYYFLLSYMAVVLVLIGVLYFAVTVTHYKESLNSERV